MKKTITSRHNIQPGMICGFFDKEVFRIGLTLSVIDATCRIAVHDTESLTLPQSRVFLASEILYPTAEPKSVIDEYYRKIHIFNAEKHLPLIRENLLQQSSPATLAEVQKLGNLPDDDVYRFALYMALRAKPGWFRFKKGLYLALTLAEEQEYYQSEEQKQLHKRDMETCPLLARKGIPVLFTDAMLQEAEAVSEYTAAQDRIDLTRLECWTIDSEKTQDLDDAISLQKKDKSWELGI
ncbi:MAG: hypothetical protein FJ041_07385, partial [Candidatus Cloacimonetes bacterium]|nr:hypothetical protein [Candidatus Cloacimonadota bacterium]